MTSSKISSKEKWENAHGLLERALKKEIGMMREILANLHQEELALLERDESSFARVMEDRSELVVQLGRLRDKRASATLKLEKLEGRLESSIESSVEIQSNLDQIIALTDRINLQNCRNDALFDQGKHVRALPLECTYPHPLHKTRRKPSVATYTRKP